MTIQSQVSVYPEVFVPRDYDVFAGLDVDHHSIAATFTDHGGDRRPQGTPRRSTERSVPIAWDWKIRA